MTRGLRLLLPVLAALATAGLAQPWELLPLSTLPAPGTAPEIVKHVVGSDLFVATDGAERWLGLYRMDTGVKPGLRMVDQDAGRSGPQGRPLPGAPTSVAAHPRHPVIFVTLLNDDPVRPGRVLGLLAEGDRLGAEVFRAETGFHPDAVTVSPDGRWLVVSDEGEGSAATAGSVSLYDLQGWSPGAPGAVAVTRLAGIGNLLGVPAGEVEPEYAAVDPKSRFVVVSCQENDALAVIDLRARPPRLATVVPLGAGAHPDGVAVCEWGGGCLVAVAEEGQKKGPGGQAVSVWTLDPGNLAAPARRLSRVDVRPLADPAKPDKGGQPESVAWQTLGGRLGLLVGVERGDCVLLFDLTDPRQPRLAARAPVGSRPEGMTVVQRGDVCFVVVANEGKGRKGGGSLTLLRWR